MQTAKPILAALLAALLFVGGLTVALPAHGPLPDGSMPTAEEFSAPALGWTTPAHFVRVVDGDTIRVEVRREITVRLRDCWAPESRTKDDHEKRLGLLAKGNLARMADEGSPLVLHIPINEGEDLSAMFTFGRAVGDVWTTENPSRSLNRRQIDAGLAWPTKEEQKAGVEAQRPK
jgi:endonuclease YncB( thermonuclease family)